MANYFTDISSWNLDSYDYFKVMKDWGAKSVVIKLTEGSENGSNYRNPKARTQIDNARANGLLVHAYHYFLGINENDAKDEARFFVKVAKELGLDPATTIMACDVEDNSLTGDRQALTNYVNAFHDEVRKGGYPHTSTYTGRYWAQTRMYMEQLSTADHWIAEYGTNQCNVRCDQWQYDSTTKFLGNATDTNIDYTGFFTTNKKSTKQGEYFEDGHWRFYEKGELVKGWYWINEPGKTVYYDNNGNMVYGQQKIGDHWYLFDKVTGAMQRGFQNLSNYGENKTVYYNQDGWMLYGWQKIDGKDYYFEPENGAVMHSVKFDKNGVASW